METQTVNRMEIPREDLRRAVAYGARQLDPAYVERAMAWCETANHCGALAWRVDGHDCPGRQGGFDNGSFGASFDHWIRSWIIYTLGQDLPANGKGIALNVIDPTEEKT